MLTNLYNKLITFDKKLNLNKKVYDEFIRTSSTKIVQLWIFWIEPLQNKWKQELLGFM